MKVIKLEWAPVEGAEGYHVSIHNIDTSIARQFPVKGTSLDVRIGDGFSKNGYYVCVRAYNSSCMGPWSEIARVGVAPPAPILIVAKMVDTDK